MRLLILLLLWFLVSCTNPAPQPASVPPTAGAPPQAQPATEPAPMSGTQLYAAYCASCHGEDGKGHGPAAPALKARLPDLTTLAKRKQGRFPEGDVYQVIKWGGGIVGHGSKQMPVWGIAFRTLSPKDEEEVNLRINSLVQYLESIQQK